MTGVAIIGSGNIGTDLMIKVMRSSGRLTMTALVGIDSASDGLARAGRLGVAAIDSGVEGLISSEVFDAVDIVFDATSAGAHLANERALRAARPDIRVIDLTPAAVGPFCVPVVNGDAIVDAPNVNMVTCGGQATVPIVAAVSSVTRVHYAEIVASIASNSAGPGTRANIDEFTETTARALSELGGAAQAKAIIVLNPAEPPLLMRDTVFTITDRADQDAIEAAVEETVARVAEYVPGYRLKQRVQFSELDDPVRVPGLGKVTGMRTSVFLEVEGAAHYLPAYAGNLDIMTSAALRTAEQIAAGLTTAGGVR